MPISADDVTLLLDKRPPPAGLESDIFMEDHAPAQKPEGVVLTLDGEWKSPDDSPAELDASPPEPQPVPPPQPVKILIEIP
jgi:hypothetical protein